MKVAWGVVVCDAWYTAEAVVQVLARRRKDWLRLLEAASVHLREVNGWTMPRPG